MQTVKSVQISLMMRGTRKFRRLPCFMDFQEFGGCGVMMRILLPWASDDQSAVGAEVYCEFFVLDVLRELVASLKVPGNEAVRIFLLFVLSLHHNVIFRHLH